MTGAVGHKRVPNEFIEDTRVPLPALKEQRRIVAVLDHAFQWIEQARVNTKKSLDNCRQLLRSAIG